MTYLIYGAGTIGITYAWLLSQKHDVDILVQPERLDDAKKGFVIHAKDLRKQASQYETATFSPNCVTQISRQYDGILVCVNRCDLKSALPDLVRHQHLTGYFAFLQNHWHIQAELNEFLNKEKTVIAFPSSVGGGRDGTHIEVIVFAEATRLGGECQHGISDLTTALNHVGIKTQYDKHIYDWLKVHYLQQSITAGAVLEKGSFLAFATDAKAVKKMIVAFREGIKVCRLQGVPVYKIFPAYLFQLPLFLLTPMMQKMLLNHNTTEMVNNHMKQGLSEWIAGYQEVLQDGIALGEPMTTWQSYQRFVDGYLDGLPKNSEVREIVY